MARDQNFSPQFIYDVRKLSVQSCTFHFGSDAEAVEALVCKTSLNGFESRRYLHFSEILKHKAGIRKTPSGSATTSNLVLDSACALRECVPGVGAVFPPIRFQHPALCSPLSLILPA